MATVGTSCESANSLNYRKLKGECDEHNQKIQKFA